MNMSLNARVSHLEWPLLGLALASLNCGTTHAERANSAAGSPSNEVAPFSKGEQCPSEPEGVVGDCAAAQSECCCGADCCSGICFDGRCAEACGQYNDACEPTMGGESECCSKACGFNGCLCGGVGMACRQHSDCCTRFCNADISACDDPFVKAPARDRPSRCLEQND